MILPSDEYMLIGCDFRSEDNSFFFIQEDDDNDYVFNNHVSLNCNLLPDGIFVINTATDLSSSVYFENVCVLDKNKNKIVEFSTPLLNHECIYGTNAPRYFSPSFDYSTLNTNVLCVQNAAVVNKLINTKENILDNIIYEYDQNGNVLWSWSASEHLDQFNFSQIDLLNLRRNPIYTKGFGDEHDWIHLNSVCAVGENKWYDNGDERFHPKNLICCSRNLSIVFIIEKQTGNIVFILKGSDFDFQYQHYAHVIPKGLPGEGNVLLLDCYQKEDEEKQARIVEIDPIVNEVVFEYYGDFHSNAMGSVQKTPDGCYLISTGHTKKILIVNDQKELLSDIDIDNLLYRANVYPIDWVEKLRKE